MQEERSKIRTRLEKYRRKKDYEGIEEEEKNIQKKKK